MIQISTAMLVDDQARVFFQRTDREGLSPVELTREECAELRVDPVAFAKARSPGPVVVHVRDEVKPTDSVKFIVRAGHDTLADALGDELYIRIKDGKLESPFDGRWKEELYPWISPNKMSENWAAIPTKTLLSVGEKQGINRYYFPRMWNEPGPWISHENLKKKYDEFTKEREQCSQVSK